MHSQLNSPPDSYQDEGSEQKERQVGEDSAIVVGKDSVKVIDCVAADDNCYCECEPGCENKIWNEKEHESKYALVGEMYVEDREIAVSD